MIEILRYRSVSYLDDNSITNISKNTLFLEFKDIIGLHKFLMGNAKYRLVMAVLLWLNNWQSLTNESSADVSLASNTSLPNVFLSE